VTESSHAVFLSYASQDAQAAQRICDALRTAGIEAWFDQSELRGGDAWDQSIRKQIKACALFVPIISKHTHERAEGYFRLEWKLAVDRSHLIMANKAFLVPVVIDETADDDENVPEKFREVQWTRLPGGVTQPEFVACIKRLLSPEPHTAAGLPASAASGSSSISRPTSRYWLLRRGLPVAVGVLVLAALAYLLTNRLWNLKPATSPAPSDATSSSGAPPAAFNPPPHSIAVLPFVNMSGDKDQEYFSDGLTEELLNSLSRINELQVAARTSSFSFQGDHPDITTIAHKLNVASVLEGSVRRSGHTVRVTAQLNNAVTGFHLWSQTYDRDLGDVLKLQTDIANAVASALRVMLLKDTAAKIELGGTRDPAAFDAYLRASKAYQDSQSKEDDERALTLYGEAVRHDPNFALAFAERSIILRQLAYRDSGKPPYFDRELFSRAIADANRATALAPNLAEGHLAQAYCFEAQFDLARANQEYERALLLAPGSARVVRNYGIFAVNMGHIDAGITAARHAVVIDPLNPKSHVALAITLLHARRYEDALEAIGELAALQPEYSYPTLEGSTYYLLGNFEKARTSCERETRPDLKAYAESCLAAVYERLGRHTDAVAILAKKQKEQGDAPAVAYAGIYAQWGEISKALQWLETAARRGDDDLLRLKVDPLLDPLRNEPRFQAIERALKFPN